MKSGADAGQGSFFFHPEYVIKTADFDMQTALDK
jgi:hypothetical protein